MSTHNIGLYEELTKYTPYLLVYFFHLIYCSLNIDLFPANPKTKDRMKIPTLSVFAIFALLGMTLGMGSYGYGSYGGYGASYVPVLAGAGHGAGAGGFGQGGFCKFFLI